ncbi:MAG TPA: glycosyltransferase family 2 protein [Candidatus Limnocylindrales bacterium]|nr:glycosyltransferase family 2 protein [Candidatus Limnocylindrales bacterium]
MREPLSVLVPVLNEIHNVRECLQSVRWAEEVVVVDSGSTDGTLEAALAVADRVLEHEYVNSAAQKNWALPRLTHRWTLIVDADERVTPALRAEIEAVLADSARLDGYWIRRSNHFLGRPIRSAGWHRDKVLRLFDRTRGAYEPLHVHAEVRIDSGKVGSLREPLLHHTYRDLDQYFEKFQRYTRWSADDLRERGVKASAARLLFRAPLRFLRMYVLQGGFREGRHGIVLCGLAAFSVFVKYARRWEQEIRGDRPDRGNRGDGRAGGPERR